jgi:hypothetical protein
VTALRGLWTRRPGLSNPYVGPRAFGSDDRLYGRDRETRELFDLLIAERIVLLHLPSGAGHPGRAALPRQVGGVGGEKWRQQATQVMVGLAVIAGVLLLALIVCIVLLTRRVGRRRP